MKLTVKNVEKLSREFTGTDRTELDDDIPGFGLRMRAGGSRTWTFRYDRPNKIEGKQPNVKIGRYPAMDVQTARERAKQLYAEVMAGGDPAGAKAGKQTKPDETYAACVKLYLSRRQKEAQSGKLALTTHSENERHLTRNLKALNSLRIDQIDRRTIAIELGRITERAPIQANRTRASASAFFKWCVGEGYREDNPITFTNKNMEQSGERVLNISELVALWLALPTGDFGDILKLLELTGQRRDEIADLRWSEVSFVHGVITLPPARTKNRRLHTIPLSSAARAILEARPRVRDLVFGRGDGGAGFSGWSQAKRRLDEKLSIPAWVIHDLRRSCSTGMGNLGIQPHIIEACLNHISGSRAGVAGIYNKSEYEAEKAIALTRWADHLMAAVEGRTTNIIPLARA